MRLQNTAVGSGAEYQISTKGKDMDMAIVNLGNEEVDGDTGYWTEMRMNSPEMGGEMVMKQLMVVSATQSGMKRMIMQQPGKPPMEMGGFMMNMMQQHQALRPRPSKGQGQAAWVNWWDGIVTVPAGTFTCQHYRTARMARDPWTCGFPCRLLPVALVKVTGAGHEHGAEEDPEQRKIAHHGRTAEDADARNAAVIRL